ncbi:N-acetylmuramoyl-L-alanine amidase isoform X2 [Zootoca vivipara]|uniref:N-acetylmuramoyl-L-alanine amidase isoform X2 n=1 Tax=Zootoca vivipara TaxID=8524 RepID=UPI0015928F7C|nr:N-acetylmuramoyl-L-alanine amidase isoform X2 [Zootoca vivipara]
MLQPWLSLLPMLFCVSVDGTDYSTLHMDSVTGVLEDFESQLKGTPDQTVTELFRELKCCEGELCQLLLGPVTSAPSDVSYLSEPQSIFFKNLVNHEVDDASLVEHGVVLTPDGTTVSLSPLLAGIAAGLQRNHTETYSSVVQLPPTLEPLFATTIAMDLGKAFLLFHTNQSQVTLGPDGCWDSISAPQTFILMGAPSPLPDAFINGAMDGLILGTYLAEKADPPSNISVLLKDYYGGEGLGAESPMRSNFRRKNFAALVSEEKLRMQVEDSLLLLRRLNESNPLFDGLTDEELRSVANQAVEEFTALYSVLQSSHGACGVPSPTEEHPRSFNCPCASCTSTTLTALQSHAEASHRVQRTCAQCRDSTRISVAGMTLATAMLSEVMDTSTRGEAGTG